jgi:hypothetical protein
MKNNNIKACSRLLQVLAILSLPVILGCKKEIDFDYNEITPIVVVEGRVSNEGTRVFISKSRSMNDSVKSRCLIGALITISVNGVENKVFYDSSAGCYRSTLKGLPGQTYQLSIDFEGSHYEASSTMPQPSTILSTEFLWQPVLQERLLAYEMWATDPEPQERNYYWYRMDRTWHHPHFEGKTYTEPYRWGVFDNRGCPPGKIYRDVMCMSEKAAEEDKEENWKRILYEGDTVTFQLMNIDRATYEYFSSLRAGQSGGANPRSNISGGCHGYFTACFIAHADTIVYSKEIVKPL